MAFDVPRIRLRNQQLSRHDFKRVDEVVAWLGAVQAQDYNGAKWALGLRLKDAVDADIEQAMTDGAILRTHVMRPTWHFVAAADIRWMVELTAPRVNAVSAYQYRALGLDDTTFAKSNRVIEKALRDHHYLTRAELATLFNEAGIETGGLRTGYLLFRAELDALICSGPRRGKQQTYALLDERAPGAMSLPREEALAELTRRYFTSHGPAQSHDFAWWSGLTVTDARRGIEMNATVLTGESVGKKTYWMGESRRMTRSASTVAYLLPNYDEYGIAYKDRSDLVHDLDSVPIAGTDYPHFFVIDGKGRGSWKREIGKDEVVVTWRSGVPLSDDERIAMEAAGERYGRFLGVRVRMVEA